VQQLPVEQANEITVYAQFLCFVCDVLGLDGFLDDTKYQTEGCLKSGIGVTTTEYASCGIP
jgi:hypothetical protein